MQWTHSRKLVRTRLVIRETEIWRFWFSLSLFSVIPHVSSVFIFSSLSYSLSRTRLCIDLWSMFLTFPPLDLSMHISCRLHVIRLALVMSDVIVTQTDTSDTLPLSYGGKSNIETRLILFTVTLSCISMFFLITSSYQHVFQKCFILLLARFL